jgi:CheY-like chemotaxis protein
MSIDDATKLLESITKLIAVLVWPGIVLFVMMRFGSDISDFLSQIGEFAVKVPGYEVSVKLREAVAALSAANASKRGTDASVASKLEGTEAAVQVVDYVTPKLIRRAANAVVLWVDDHPEKNAYERQALEALGVHFVLATSTEEALNKIERRRRSFNAIISDMHQPLDQQSGFTLLDKLRSKGNKTPCIIYASSASTAEAKRRGAIGATNSPNELFQMVMAAL